MTAAPCLFCAIASKKQPVPLVYEDEQVVAFPDIHPKATTHLLVIPKRHIEQLATATDDDRDALEALLPAVSAIAQTQRLSGFKLVVNNGTAYGQSVPHLHLHLLSGQFNADSLQSL